MGTVRALLPAFGAGFAFTLGGSADKVAFDPQPGSSVTRTFTLAGEFQLDDLSMIVNGQDIAGMLPALELSITRDTKIEVTDTFKSVAGGRPTELVRAFDAVTEAMRFEMTPAEAEMPEFTSSSALEGETVVFRWNPEKQSYETTFEDGEGDESLLEGLEEDMDLRLFLPTSEVAEDESWTVELSELQCLIAPGGNLHAMPEGIDVDPASVKMFEELFAGFGEELEDLLEGECRCTYKGVQEEDGARIAEIAIDLEVATNLDLTEILDKAIRMALEQQGAGDMVEVSLDTADLNLDYEGTGTLLWDLRSARVHSFQVSGDVTIDMDLSVSVEAEGESQSIDASFEMSGQMREEVATKE